MKPTRAKNKTIVELEKDELYNKWYNSFDRINTQLSYRNGLRAFCEFAEAFPSDLIKEAREDYINRVAPWELRHIQRIDLFVANLKKDKTANYTKLNYIKAIKHFYIFNKIPVDLKIDITQKATEQYLDIPLLKIEDIRKAVLSTGINSFLKAFILTTLSSGQGQNEIRLLKGKHLKNEVNGVCIVNMTRGKTQHRYFFFIGKEALDSIKEYKKDIGDEEFIFTQKREANKNKPLKTQTITTEFERHADKLGYPPGYFAPHRLRHFFKTTLTDNMNTEYIEFLMGHRLSGVQSSYFLGKENAMLEAYLKNQHLLTVFTDKEVLQKQYDELKTKQDNELDTLKQQVARLNEFLEKFGEKGLVAINKGGKV